MAKNLFETLVRFMRTTRCSHPWQAEFNNGLLCFLGSIALALGVTVFLQPNQIASGGTPGIAILLCHLSGLTTGTVMLAINIPLLIFGYYYLGQGFVWRTVVAVTVMSGLIDLFNEVLMVEAITRDPLMGAFCGGAAIGVGVGLILKGKASAGGPTIIARIIATRTHLRPGRVILVMDAAIVVSSALVFGAIEPALLSMLSVFVTGRCIDLVLGDNGLKSDRLSSSNCSNSPAN